MIGRLSPAARLTLGLVSLALTLLMVLDLVLGVFPNAQQQALESRQRSAESLATQVATLLTSDGGTHRAAAALETFVHKTSEALSAGVRGQDKRLLLTTADHDTHWQTADSKQLGRSRFIVPIRSGGAEGRPWGQVEVSFKPLPNAFVTNFLLSPTSRLMFFFTLAAGTIFYLYLRRTFQHLDPASAVPERVQMAFDALSEAVLVLNGQGRIVMHNHGFEALMPAAGEAMTGRSPDSFDWLRKSPEYTSMIPPWQECMRSRKTLQGIPYEAHQDDGEIKRLVVNCSPVLDSQDVVRGCMVSFSDVTELEEGRRQLVELMTELTLSKEQLEAQNTELQRLASVDPMTGALNRRSFFPIFERMFKEAREQNLPFSFAMCDIDKFKGINDLYGHQTGDLVIQKFASVLLKNARDTDIVCRYGGEEFCVALPGTDPKQARIFGERVREAIERELREVVALTDRPAITASLGIASVDMGATSATELADQADQALYHSKNTGRNRVTVYSRIISSKDAGETRPVASASA